MIFGIFVLIMLSAHCWGIWWVLTLVSGRCKNIIDCLTKIACTFGVAMAMVFLEIKQFAVPLAAIKYLFT